MGRRPGTAKICVICGDKAKGINFGAATCLSCKAFFRRNALQNKELTCPFGDKCSIGIVSRRFCTKCRLKKCFEQGMKKEWILSDEERLKIKEKIRLNKLKRQEDEARNRLIAGLFNSESSAVSTPPPDSTTSFSPMECEDLDQSEKNPNDTTNQPDMLASIMPTIFNGEAPGQSDQTSDQNPTNSLEMTSPLSELCEDLLIRPESVGTSLFDGELDLSCLSSPSFSGSSGQGHAASSDSHLTLYQTSKYEALLEFVPECLALANAYGFPPITITPLYSTPNCFPYQELILPESCLLKELSSACTVLQNPYKRIEVLESMNVDDASKISQFMFHRLIRASRALSGFNELTREDQGQLLKGSLLKMLSIRSVVMYNANRECWGFIDDSSRSNVMVSMKYIEPYCTKASYQRHRNLPSLFRDEWIQDSIIFDLLTAIVLFTPRPEYSDYGRVQSEHARYKHLLLRYLTLKYPSREEAEDCYRVLLANIEEMFDLNDDILSFMRSFHLAFKSTRFYVELLDLDGIDGSKSDPANRVPEIEPAITEIFPEAMTAADEESLFSKDLLWL